MDANEKLDIIQGGRSDESASNQPTHKNSNDDKVSNILVEAK